MTPVPLFGFDDLEAASDFHARNGVVSFSGLLSAQEFGTAKATMEAAIADGRLRVAESELASNNDVVLLDPVFEALARNPRIVAILRRLVGHPIELQHAKFNAKPPTAQAGEVAWHQDYPFYPHTNFDLVSCTLHFDDEDVDSGPVCFLPGSQLLGPLSHVGADGKFAYGITGMPAPDPQRAMAVVGPAGFVSFHHALTVHMSHAKRRPGHRRLLVLQYRAIDAVQLAGVVWRCNGMQVEPLPPAPRRARFVDGTVVDLRGIGGRLFDVGRKFAPDLPAP